MNWSVSPNIGTISTTGLYTPPATFDPNNTNVVITATTTTTPPVAGSASIQLSNTILSTGWSVIDLASGGAPGAVAGMSTNPGVVLDGKGTGISGGTTDTGYYLSTAASGDVTLVARLSKITNPLVDGSAVLMFRSTTGANSAHVAIGRSADTGMLRTVVRTTAAGYSVVNNLFPVPVPYWLKLTRSGSTITAAASPDGVVWTDLYSTTALGSGAIRAGFAVGSGSSTQSTTATFDNWTFSQSPQVTMRLVPLNQNATVAGGRSTYQVNVSALNGFNGNINFSLLGLPANASYAVQPASLNGSGTAILTVTASPGVKAGIYSLALNGTGPGNPSAPATLVIGASATGAMPTNFAANNVGTTQAGGAVTYANGAFTLNPPPGNIDGLADAFQFASQTLAGDLSTRTLISETTDKAMSFVRNQDAPEVIAVAS